MDAGDLRRAYAVLGLSPPVTPARLKRRYKSLVRRWHPDRFQSDPAGQAEATQRLRDINIAFETVSDAIASISATEPARNMNQPESTAAARPARSNRHSPNDADQSFHLTPEEMDAIVDSINQQNRIFSWSGTLDANRILSGVVALIWLWMCGVGGGLFAVLKGSLVIIVPILFIWFPKTFDRWTIQQPADNRSLPAGWFFRVIGWVLFGFLIFALIMIVAPTL